MSWRLKLSNFLDVVLRIPPLLVLNSVMNGSFLPLMITDEQILGMPTILRVLIVLTVTALCLIAVLLTVEQLVCAYSVALAYGTLFLSYHVNRFFVMRHLDRPRQPLTDTVVHSTLQQPAFEHSPWQIFLMNSNLFLTMILIQCILAVTLKCLNNELNRLFRRRGEAALRQPLQASCFLFFLMPVILALLSLPNAFLFQSPALSAVLAGLEFSLSVFRTGNLRKLSIFVQITWIKTLVIIRNFGFQWLLDTQWQRLHIPITMRLFWTSRIGFYIVHLTCVRILQNVENKTTGLLTYDDVINLAREAVIIGSDTQLSVLGMASMISLVVHYVGELCILILGTYREEDRYMGMMSAILFYILALQTGLSGMPPAKRLGRLYCNVCLLVMAMLHFIHGMVHPELLAISAGRNLSVKRHARSLFISAFLIVFPSVAIAYLWNSNPISTWLCAVIAFGVELVVKVIISLVIYCLFMVDAQMEDFWEGLDDYIYYVKSTGSTIEFMFGLFLFGNGAWILIFESGGTVRALMMCIHAYFNIWSQAKEGWNVFMKRRLAVTKISQLPVATAGQLREYADVCAICYHELNSARVTKCHHMFHGVCLRKWLYIQDQCPLCHQTICVLEPNEHQLQNHLES